MFLTETIFVHAAGNSGVTQTQDIEWDVALDPTLIVVGSVGFDGTISDFSNRPGDACFLDASGACNGNLKDRFLVAPGEFILVTDGQGGVTRASGTSFAAPIVTGAIALMQDRWSWLKEYPKETADILFATATDLGEEGVDGVYGHGLLNIEAAQSPIDWDEAYFYTEHTNGKLKKYKVKDLGAYNTSKSKNKKTDIWHAEDGYFVAFEDVGATYRDFLIPLNDSLVGTYADIDGINELFQDYLHGGFVDWVSTLSFSQDQSAAPYYLETKLSFSPLTADDNANNRLPYRADLEIHTPGQMAFRFGQGDAGSKLGFAQQNGVMSAGSHPLTGGANPILGFASGGVYAGMDLPLNDTMKLSFGATERRVEHNYADPTSGEMIALYGDLDAYQSTAVNMGLSNRITERFSLNASYTALTEANGMLGMQSLNPSDFGAGSATDAATLGASYQASQKLMLSASATYGATHSRDDSAAIRADNLSSTAFELAMTSSSLLLDGDAFRFAIIQPMHVETGALNVDSYEVIDRSTGEIGATVNSFDLSSGGRRLALEGRYGARFNDGDTELSAFVRMEGARGDSAIDEFEHMIGGRLAFTY